MEIQQITEGKRDYMDMLLLADPQEDMIMKYLDQGDLFVLYDQGQAVTVAVVVLLNHRKCELKNIATMPEVQRKGYGRYMIHFLCEHYSNRCDLMYVGTGNSEATLGFYRECGFEGDRQGCPRYERKLREGTAVRIQGYGGAQVAQHHIPGGVQTNAPRVTVGGEVVCRVFARHIIAPPADEGAGDIFCGHANVRVFAQRPGDVDSIPS